MDTSIQNLKLVHFRNYDHLCLDNFSHINVLCGENGVGKTNVLEALSLVTNLESFRSTRNKDLIQHQHSEASIRVVRTLSFSKRDVELWISDTKKQIIINNKKKTKKDLLSHAASLVFTPDDLFLVKQGSSIKRDSLDVLASRVSPAFKQLRRDFGEILRYKNTYLKEDTTALMLDVVNESFVRLAAQYTLKRLSLIKYINSKLPQLYSQISHEEYPVFLNYTFSWDDDTQAEYSLHELLSLHLQDIEELLALRIVSYKHKEQERAHALIGPQADKVSFIFNGNNAQYFASQGQQRAIVLAYKLAQLQFLEEIQGSQPILLLDDVYSELDSIKRKNLSNLILGRYQVFITCTEFDPSLYPEMPQVYTIRRR